jgi:hypothetical protein
MNSNKLNVNDSAIYLDEKVKICYLKSMNKYNCDLSTEQGKAVYNLLYHRERGKEFRIKGKEKQKEYYREWYKRNGRIRSENYKECIIEWRLKRPEEVKIHKTIASFISKGLIKRPDICSICNRKTRVQTHHRDYKHWAHFIWACASCHKQLHQNTKD